MDVQNNDTKQSIEQNQNQPESTPIISEVVQEETPKYELVICDKQKKAENRHSLEEENEVVIGADPTCSVMVDDECISSKHFSVSLIENSIEVKDLGSRNGLYLLLDNPTKILPGQTLLAGKTIFKLEEKKDD
jgi:pSer/pThr/pTyr-binding forkhead associated (FHA) protein|tara:strand:- start:771 stop:1169 length:399 start_codon:yes stop_codon:yes gene_type:complete